VVLSNLERASILGQRHKELRGRSVLIATDEQLTAALALIELDGIAGQLVLCPPGQSIEELRATAKEAHADAWIVDRADPDDIPTDLGRVLWCNHELKARVAPLERPESTEWVLLTSGTTGAAKLVSHSLSSLADPVQRPQPPTRGTTWGTCYDIRRYGGLQILLRALLGGGSLVLSDPVESVREFLTRAAASKVTHLTGTPSHWRRILMSGFGQLITPEYVRLSGEIADQQILDNLRTTYPAANIVHAFASTEAGLAFEVTDGLEGFPQDAVGQAGSGVEILVEDGAMLIRSARTASRYLNHDALPLRRDDGFVNTHDLVQLRDGRYHFVGRHGGVINIGGLKCHPEEIESVINRHPRVRMSLVKARKSPLLGSVVVAEVVLSIDGASTPSEGAREAIRREIMESCRRALSAHKVPATIRIVPSLEVAPSGKLRRPNA
jgi:acyl-coenzyme A synthetase/AMP-(fatty) acid ligase